MAKKTHVQFILSDEDQALLEARAAEADMPPNMFARATLVAMLRGDARWAAFNAVFWRVYGTLRATLAREIYPLLEEKLISAMSEVAETPLEPALEPLEGEVDREPLDGGVPMDHLEGGLGGKRRRRGKRGGRGRS